MAASSTAHPETRAVDHCGYHHGPVDQCPPINPELGDVLPDLLHLGVDVRITAPVDTLGACAACHGDPDIAPSDAVATVVLTRRPAGGYQYREAACAGCLRQIVVGEQRRNPPPHLWVEVPATIDASHAATQSTIRLDDYRHPHQQEWRYGPDRGPWTGGHPIVADHTGLSITGGLDVARDDIPHFIAWLTAVHAATRPDGAA